MPAELAKSRAQKIIAMIYQSWQTSRLELLFERPAALGEFELSLCSAVCGGGRSQRCPQFSCNFQNCDL